MVEAVWERRSDYLNPGEIIPKHDLIPMKPSILTLDGAGLEIPAKLSEDQINRSETALNTSF